MMAGSIKKAAPQYSRILFCMDRIAIDPRFYVSNPEAFRENEINTRVSYVGCVGTACRHWITNICFRLHIFLFQGSLRELDYSSAFIRHMLRNAVLCRKFG